jgi:uncharacterized protein (DUF2267 family)
MAVNFNKYAEEGNIFMKNLAEKLNHPDEINRTGIIYRAVTHTLRDSITIGESLNLIAQLPMFLKAIYVDDWKYREKPLRLSSIEEFKDEVKKRQELYGENRFNWEKPTDEIIKTVLGEIQNYVSQGEIQDIKSQLPQEIKGIFDKTGANA